MKYKCSRCGQEHDEWPALAFSSPTAYNELTHEDTYAKKKRGDYIAAAQKQVESEQQQAPF